MQFDYTLAIGLVLFIIGISFLWHRINFIKKGNLTLATLFKLEARLDAEGDTVYIPYFTFTTYNNKEITYKHTEWNPRLKLGDKIKVVYKEEYLDDHEVLLLEFNNVFGLATILLTAGIIFLIVAGGIYWNTSEKTLWYLIPASICFTVAGIKIWSERFFNTLH